MSRFAKQMAPLGRVIRTIAAAGVLASLTTGALLAPAHASNAAKKAKDTCSIARIKDVSLVIGRILSDPTQDGPRPDDANPSVTNTRCQFDAENGHITIISNLFPSSETAGTAFDQAIDNVKSAVDSAGRSPSVTEEQGLGDDAYWVTSVVETDTTDTQQGQIVKKGTYFVHSGVHFVSVGTDWSDQDPDSLRPALKTLVQSVISLSQTASR